MKKLSVTLLILFTAFISFSQGLPKIVPRTSDAITVQDPRLKASLNLYIPVVSDTTSALNGGLDSLGAIIQVRSTGKQYKRDTVLGGGHKWTEIGSGGSGIVQVHTNNNHLLIV